VPEDWRKASVTTIFKKDKKEDPGNYRPVSLTSIPLYITYQQVCSRPLKSENWIYTCQKNVMYFLYVLC